MTPHFNSLAEFIAMGKHGPYVWASYGLTALFIIGLILYSRMQRQATYRAIHTQQARAQQRQNRRIER